MFRLAAIENVFFLLLVAIVGLIRWAMQAGEEKKNTETAKRAGSQPANAPPPRAPATSEEERIRKFMEALGVPTSNAPPPKVQPPRQAVPKRVRELKRKIRPIDPFPTGRARPWIPEPDVFEPAPPIILPSPAPAAETPLPAHETTTLVRTLAPEFELRTVGFDAGEGPAAKSWAARLTSAGGLRDAIILREIFGPPRSMQENA